METFVFITDIFTKPMLQLLQVAYRKKKHRRGGICATKQLQTYSLPASRIVMQ